jgi:Fe-S cluster assembly ATP-binding protein
MPGMRILDFMKTVYGYAEKLQIPEQLLKRSIGEDFSGGEKKKIELLCALVLKPKYAIFDEIDTGLDVDALKIIADGIRMLQSDNTGILIITHTNRILKYLKPDTVNILIHGEIVRSGGSEIVAEIEADGYRKYQ